VSARSGLALDGHARFMNVIGNVFGDSSQWSRYETEGVDSSTSIFNLGFKGNCSGCINLSNHTHVKRTLFRWGNWDNVTNDTRWCSDATSPCTASEVPSGITNYPNPVPANLNLPDSFYLVSKPAFFGSLPWPPIGPDVMGGNLSGSGGYANKTPARICFEESTDDAAYSSFSPRVKMFNAANCYGAEETVQLNPPINLRIMQ
jgi:hypothetical protein